MSLIWLLLVPRVNECSSRGYPMLVSKVRGASSEIILVVHLNEIRDPRPHKCHSIFSLLFQIYNKKVLCKKDLQEIIAYIFSVSLDTAFFPQRLHLCCPMRFLVGSVYCSWDLQVLLIYSMLVWIPRFFLNVCICAIPCVFQWVPCTVHGTCKYFFSTKTTLKLGPTTLFTYLKIILLQCFQFLGISGIQTDPQSIKGKYLQF